MVKVVDGRIRFQGRWAEYCSLISWIHISPSRVPAAGSPPSDRATCCVPAVDDVKNLARTQGAKAFFGGDAGEGLDLRGNFIYAVNVAAFGNASHHAGDAVFAPDSIPGVAITATSSSAQRDLPRSGYEDRFERAGGAPGSLHGTNNPGGGALCEGDCDNDAECQGRVSLLCSLHQVTV